MDGHRKFADTYFQERSRFIDVVPETFTVLEGLVIAEETRVTERSIPAAELVGWASRTGSWMTHSTPIQGDIRLVEIGMSPDRKLRIGSPIFDSIFSAFKLDRCIKYFQAHNIEGFYPFGIKPRRISSGEESVLSFFLNPVGLCHLAWSYDTQNYSTSAILIASDESLPYLRGQLILYQRVLLNPFFLGFACMTQVIQVITLEIEQQLGALSDAEELTGTNLEYNEPDTDFFQKGKNRQDLATLSKQVGSASVAVAVNIKPMKLIHEFCEVLVSDTMGLGKMVVASDRRRHYHAAWDDLAEAASILQLEARSMIDIVHVVEKRVSLQLNIIYNLIAKADADASIRLAEAAKHDSSSMKTIAVVTMTFLPATFFAAVFAMPLLQWNSSPVVQDNFWVYLVFALPSTALVFAVWAIVTQRHVIKQVLVTEVAPRLRKLMKGSNKKELAQA